MRIVALHAICGRERLPLMSLDQRFIFGVMAVETQRGRRLCQVKIKLFLTALAGLVRHVAGLASHVECSVAATLLRNVHSLVMASEAQVLSFVA